MTDQEKQSVLDTIENEGFEYTFMNYSTFEEIKDVEFRRLREAYIAADKALAAYVGAEV